MKTPTEIAEEIVRSPLPIEEAIALVIHGERNLVEEARRQMGCCGECGFNAWKKDGSDPKREHCQFCAAQERIAELEKALEPMAEAARETNPREPDYAVTGVSLRACRRAADLLKK